MSEATAERGEATTFCTVPEAIAAIARGEVVVVVDDEDRESEGDLIIAAEAATPEALAFFVRHRIVQDIVEAYRVHTEERVEAGE